MCTSPGFVEPLNKIISRHSTSRIFQASNYYLRYPEFETSISKVAELTVQIL